MNLPTSALALGALLPLVGATVMTAWLVRATSVSGILDHPNERSSHTRPTPRGGGLAIVATTVATTLVLFATGGVPAAVAASLAGAGTVVALTGAIDDVRGLTARVRMGVYLLAAAAAVTLLGGLPSLWIGDRALSLGAAGWLLAVLWTGWMTNLYNFMDGIDGIAGAQAVTAGLGGFVLLWSAGDTGNAILALAIAAGALGFLRFNWSPARIFLGDVGSSFLGFTFAVLALATERRGTLSLLIWVILLLPFIFDASVTLVRRVLQGESLAVAHRNHAYQRAVHSGLPHGRVAAAVAVTSMLLWVPAWAAFHDPAAIVPALGTAVLLVVVVYGAVELRDRRVARLPR